MGVPDWKIPPKFDITFSISIKRQKLFYVCDLLFMFSSPDFSKNINKRCAQDPEIDENMKNMTFFRDEVFTCQHSRGIKTLKSRRTTSFTDFKISNFEMPKSQHFKISNFKKSKFRLFLFFQRFKFPKFLHFEI